MIPNTVGELKKLLSLYPDDMPFELEVNSAYGIYETNFTVEQRNVGYDGTKCEHIKDVVLILNVTMDS